MLNNLFLSFSSDPLPGWQVILIIAGFFLSSLLLAAIPISIGYARKVRSRATAEPLCRWEYSASEWRRYAEIYGLGKKPQGAARVRVTPLDIWIADESKTVRLELDERLKCVTDCRLANNILKMRVLWVSVSGRGAVKAGADDFQLFVPVGREADALKVVAYFKENRAQNGDKIALITRHNALDRLVKDAWRDQLLDGIRNSFIS